jgi:hypothetical protein
VSDGGGGGVNATFIVSRDVDFMCGKRSEKGFTDGADIIQVSLVTSCKLSVR